MSCVPSSSASRPSCSDFVTRRSSSTCFASKRFLYASAFLLSMVPLGSTTSNLQTSHCRQSPLACQDQHGNSTEVAQSGRSVPTCATSHASFCVEFRCLIWFV